MPERIKGPRQPQNLEDADGSFLASLGHRIEAWEALKDVSIPLAVRIEDMKQVTAKEIGAREKGRENEPNFEPDQEMLIQDLDILDSLAGEDEETIADVCDGRIKYYIETRDDFLNEIQK